MPLHHCSIAKVTLAYVVLMHTKDLCIHVVEVLTPTNSIEEAINLYEQMHNVHMPGPKQAVSSWSGPEVGVAFINYIQVRRWVWQFLNIMIVIVIIKKHYS